MTKYLFVDTETAGLPKRYGIPPSSDDNWPRMLQLAWVLCDGKNSILGQQSHYVKPAPDLVIDQQATAVHGLTLAKLQEEGKPLEWVLSRLMESYKLCDVMLCHNLDFDWPVLQSEIMRASLKYWAVGAYHLCTMKTSMDYCKLPSPRGGYKWPKLSELYFAATGKELEGAHDAGVDIRALKEAFFEAQEYIWPWKRMEFLE